MRVMPERFTAMPAAGEDGRPPAAEGVVDVVPALGYDHDDARPAPYPRA
ncbi:hypothetical protein [Actinomadura monticuli]|uniref:Uncharacterized protein n=1 Tax=Actinomadura monticuli TaxID=3097367 RepID=A0ABV4QHB7_9ACTN